MSQIFESEDIDYFNLEAENELVKEFRLVVDRIIIPIQNQIYLYSLPEFVFDIRRITYRGRQLYPYSGAEHIHSGSTPTKYSGGEPREYIYNYIGKKTIRLFPTPMETLVPTGDPWLGSVIREQCVMEFYRPPDFEDEFKRLPSFCRQQFTENFAIAQMSQQDAQAFDSRTIKRFEERWNQDKLNMAKFKERLFKMSWKVSNGVLDYSRTQPGRPTLPWNFGRIVE